MNNPVQKENNNIDINKLVQLALKNWYWFLISTILFVVAAYFYIKTSPYIYYVDTSILIHEESTGPGNAGSILLKDLGYDVGSLNFSNEIRTLKSSKLVDRAIQGLDYQVSYYKKDRFIDKEMYKTSPFVVIVNQEHPQPVECEFIVQIIDKNNYSISVDQEFVTLYNLSSKQRVKNIPRLHIKSQGQFKNTLRSENLEFKLILNSNYKIEDLINQEFSFKIHTQENLVIFLKNSISVTIPDRNSTEARIGMQTNVPQKAIDFLNSLTYNYLKYELERKQFMSNKTIEYINNQLINIRGSLQSAERDLQQFRSRNELIDISTQSDRIFQELSGMETEKSVLEMDRKYYEYLEEYFQKENDVELIAPSAMGLDDAMLNNLITELITLNAEKNSLIENKQEKSPYLRQINIRIENLQSMIEENISYYKQTTQLTLNDLNARINQLNAEIRKLPKTQNELIGYQRQFNINDALYSYLLEKKSEAEIAKASNQSSVEILEPANTNWLPISPNKKSIYMAAFLSGLIITFLIFVLINLLTKTFTDEEEIKKSLNLPYFGHIPKNIKKVEEVVSAFPNSYISESFRKLRSSIQYSNTEKHPKLIVVTSTISQEGKSFISLNLALSCAVANKKVILLGFDLRKPRLFKELGNLSSNGISDYLTMNANLNEIIQETHIPNLSIAWAGHSSPNPSELIASQYTEDMLMQLKHDYDFVIIDTAPIGILSDAFPILKLADLSLYVTRIKRTPRKDSLKIVEELKEKNITNLGLIINNLPIDKKEKYGYGYYEKK